MFNHLGIGSLTVPPETLGWSRAPSMDKQNPLGTAKAYLDTDGRPFLFAPGVTPGLRIMTVGQYPKAKRRALPE